VARARLNAHVAPASVLTELYMTATFDETRKSRAAAQGGEPNASEALVPPKPNELESAARIGRLRAT
jgi:hypothetical protein